MRLIVTNNRRPLLPLEEGLWVEFPNEVIPPHCCTEFGVQSGGLFVGTAGSVTYEITGQNMTCTFQWDQPGVGPFRSWAEQTVEKFTISTHTEKLNEGTLIFHVMDPTTLPKIQVIEARALSPGQSASWSRDLSDAVRDYVDVTEQLVHYLQCNSKRMPSNESGPHASSKGKVRPSTSAHLAIEGNVRLSNEDKSTSFSAAFECAELRLVSPRAFFCSLQSSNSGPKRVAPNFAFLLKWQIASEVFASIWGPDEHVWLHGGVVGGLDDKSVIIHASILLLRNTPPTQLTGEKLGRTREGRSVVRSVAPSDDRGSPKSDKSIKEALLDIALAGMRELVVGLQPLVIGEMRSRYGNDWLRYLPPGHVWKGSGSESTLDIEGLLHVVTAYWNEAFESKIPNPSVLHKLQGVAIYWANQELSKFDADYVLSFLHTAANLLEELGISASAKIFGGFIRQVKSLSPKP